MNKFEIIAHRGASGNNGDNNKVSIQKAINIGCTIIEIDIRLTSDNYIVLKHDSNLYINNKYFIIEKSKYKSISSNICLLNDIIECSPNNIVFYLDVKTDNNINIFAHHLYNVLNKYLNRKFIVASFDLEFIKIFKLNNNIKLGVILEEYHEKTIEPYFNKISYIILDVNYLDKLEIIQIFKIICKKILYVYTVNDISIIDQYKEVIDGIITDYPENFIK